MTIVNLQWITPNAEQQISDMARVSNPSNQGKDGTALIKYLIDNRHWSPLEMASMCVKIETTRDISHQIIRHRSFSYQEFSQRYANIDLLTNSIEYSEARLQDVKNRQSSLATDDEYLKNWWLWKQHYVIETCHTAYREAIEKGIAKEVARKVLPEGLTTTQLYMTGTLRSWVHYLQVRGDPSTQKEHREVAVEVFKILKEHCPNIAGVI